MIHRCYLNSKVYQTREREGSITDNPGDSTDYKVYQTREREGSITYLEKYGLKLEYIRPERGRGL